MIRKNLFKSPTSKLIKEQLEEELYLRALTDLENGIINEALWAKTLADSDGDANKQKAIYLKSIVQRYKDITASNDEIQAKQLKAQQKIAKQEAKLNDKNKTPEELQKESEQEKARKVEAKRLAKLWAEPFKENPQPTSRKPISFKFKKDILYILLIIVVGYLSELSISRQFDLPPFVCESLGIEIPTFDYIPTEMEKKVNDD